MQPLGDSGAAALPGWYPDPQQQGRLRYWDGEVWTASTAPLPAAAHAYTGAATLRSTNGMAIASLVCGVASFVLCGITAILGVVFGHIARKQIRESGGREDGEGLALAGLIISYVVLAIGITALIFLFAVVGSVDSMSD